MRESFCLYFSGAASSGLTKQKSMMGRQKSNGLLSDEKEEGACPVHQVDDKYKVNRCPFGHGSVSPDPYPGR